MKYRLTAGPMLINGVIYDKGDIVEIDDVRALAWAARLEPADQAKPIPAPEPEATTEDAPEAGAEGDDEPVKPTAPVIRKRRTVT